MSSTTTDTDDADGDAQIPDHFVESHTVLQRDLLVAIDKLDEPCGIDVKRYLKGVGYEALDHGRLYPNLDRLADVGLVEIGQKDRRTNEYTLTDDGRSALEEYRAWLTGGDGQ